MAQNDNQANPAPKESIFSALAKGLPLIILNIVFVVILIGAFNKQQSVFAKTREDAQNREDSRAQSAQPDETTKDEKERLEIWKLATQASVRTKKAFTIRTPSVTRDLEHKEVRRAIEAEKEVIRDRKLFAAGLDVSGVTGNQALTKEDIARRLANRIGVLEAVLARYDSGVSAHAYWNATYESMRSSRLSLESKFRKFKATAAEKHAHEESIVSAVAVEWLGPYMSDARHELVMLASLRDRTARLVDDQNVTKSLIFESVDYQTIATYAIVLGIIFGFANMWEAATRRLPKYNPDSSSTASFSAKAADGSTVEVSVTEPDSQGECPERRSRRTVGLILSASIFIGLILILLNVTEWTRGWAFLAIGIYALLVNLAQTALFNRSDPFDARGNVEGIVGMHLIGKATAAAAVAGVAALGYQAAATNIESSRAPHVQPVSISAGGSTSGQDSALLAQAFSSFAESQSRANVLADDRFEKVQLSVKESIESVGRGFQNVSTKLDGISSHLTISSKDHTENVKKGAAALRESDQTNYALVKSELESAVQQLEGSVDGADAQQSEYEEVSTHLTKARDIERTIREQLAKGLVETEALIKARRDVRSAEDQQAAVHQKFGAVLQSYQQAIIRAEDAVHKAAQARADSEAKYAELFHHNLRDPDSPMPVWSSPLEPYGSCWLKDKMAEIGGFRRRASEAVEFYKSGNYRDLIKVIRCSPKLSK